MLRFMLNQEKGFGFVCVGACAFVCERVLSILGWQSMTLMPGNDFMGAVGGWKVRSIRECDDADGTCKMRKANALSSPFLLPMLPN